MQISGDTTMGALGIRRERFWNAPNSITVGRIAASFLLLLLPFIDGAFGSRVMGLGFLAVSLTDLLDGYLARRDGTITRIGKLLDPLADKVLLMTAFIMLVAVGRIPDWGVPMVVLILSRELAVTSLRAMASSEGVVLQASVLGKWKTGLQTAAITCLLMHYTWLYLPLQAIGMFLLVLATAVTLWSGYDYFVSYLGRRQSGPATGTAGVDAERPLDDPGAPTR